MNKFWKWMEEKDYAKECWSHIENKRIWRLKEIENHSYTKPTKQMLIGYLREFSGFDINKEYDELIKKILDKK